MRLRMILSLAALLISATSLPATVKGCRPINSFEQGHELRQSQMAAAYNAPARIDVRGSWDLYVSASYIYWQPSEENLELGISNASSGNALPINGNAVNLNFKYKSGFKVALGVFSDTDNWDALAEYTWVGGRHSAHSNGPLDGGLLPFWGHPANVADDIIFGKSRWRVHFDLLDLTLGRSCYVGTRMIFRPFFGARAAWIDQKYIVSYTPLGAAPYQISEETDSWALGPETGLDMNFLIGSGFRLIGKAETDLLFTRYNLKIKEQDSVDPSGPLAVDFKQNHLFYLRPHLDLEMGFGWGSYFCNHNYHIDLSATYGFQIFWSQNMFRSFVDSSAVGKSFAPNGDLYIQGVTGTVRFDF